MRGTRRLKPTIFHKKNRKGQFYLLAAIIIITLIVGFVTVVNYSHKRSPVKLYDLGEELGIESQNILDYGTFTYPDDDVAMNTVWENFITDYKNYAGNGKNLYFIFGNSGDLKVKAYEDLLDVSSNFMATEEGGKVSIEIETVTYEFDLISGQNFYFVVSQEIEGEKYIVTG